MRKLPNWMFAVIGAIVVLITLIAIGYSASKNTSDTKADRSAAQSAPDETATAPKAADSSDDAPHLHVEEWGVAIAFASADKVNYRIVKNPDGSQSAALYFDDSVTYNDECQALGVGFNRSTAIPAPTANATKVGNYYYQYEGAPGPCAAQDEDDEAANALKAKITSSEIPSAKITAAD